MNSYIHINSTNKAKQDIDTLMQSMNFTDLAIKGIGGRSVETFIRKFLSMVSIFFRLKRGDVLVVQYPFKKFYVTQCLIARLKGAKTITLIHDLGAFRRRKLTIQQEIKRLSHTDYIIVHNEYMKSWLERHNCKVPMGCLGIFDYLSDYTPSEYTTTEPHNHIVYAGKIAKRKNMFWYKASDAIKGCQLDLYGPCDLDQNQFGESINYNGFIPSDKFINSIQADWGLVWDGDSVDGLTGTWGEYLKLNNPHKTSFYLRASLPVIVCRESAMARFVNENKVGISVSSLSELPQKLATFKGEEYNVIKSNVKTMAERLQSGFYFRHALDEALSTIQ